jgi:hypothetical protein
MRQSGMSTITIGDMKMQLDSIPKVISNKLNEEFKGFLNDDTEYNMISILREDALSIYTIRYSNYQRTNDNHGTITGYKEALANLSQFKDDYVSIHILLNVSTFCLFFLDSAANNIIGYITG